MALEIVLFLMGSFFGACLLFVILTRKHAVYILDSEKEKITLLSQLESAKSEAQLRDSLHSEKFEVFAQDLLKKGSLALQQSSSASLEGVLKPLREKLREFESKVERVYESEARERFNLKKEIEKMAFASESLGRALRGDFKTQGVWGEIILEKVLETSGLREGFEYTTQGRNLGLQNEEGARFKPDVIVHLPEGRHLIIDSKVSLSAFERWINNEIEVERDAALRSFTSAVKQHVQSLSEKHYQALEKLRSPDFVFLFFPIEAALVALHEKDPALFHQAWQRKVVLVGPSTLLPTLKTVEAIWKNERQNENALEIARIGGTLYDKFVSFCDDLLTVGKSLSFAQTAYDEALKKLRDGKGNLLRQSERLKELGVRTQKTTARELALTASESESSGD